MSYIDVTLGEEELCIFLPLLSKNVLLSFKAASKQLQSSLLYMLSNNAVNVSQDAISHNSQAYRNTLKLKQCTYTMSWPSILVYSRLSSLAIKVTLSKVRLNATWWATIASNGRKPDGIECMQIVNSCPVGKVFTKPSNLYYEPIFTPCIGARLFPLSSKQYLNSTYFLPRYLYASSTDKYATELHLSYCIWYGDILCYSNV